MKKLGIFVVLLNLFLTGCCKNTNNCDRYFYKDKVEVIAGFYTGVIGSVKDKGQNVILIDIDNDEKNIVVYCNEARIIR
jgi:uncharacterized UPF0146 family protein